MALTRDFKEAVSEQIRGIGYRFTDETQSNE